MFKILFPTDFSKNAQSTLDHFCSWFNPSKVELVIFHAIVPPKSVGGGLVSIHAEMAKIAEEEMGKELSRIRAKFSHTIEGFCQSGFMEDCLNVAITKTNADLTVMCSKGESNLESKIFGSNAEHCLRNVKHPIFVIPTQVPDKLEHFTYASEDGNLSGSKFLASFLAVFDIPSFKIEKLKICKKSEEMNNEYSKEEFLGKEINLHLHQNDNVIDGIEEWIELNNTDAIILNTHHTKWYDYLLNNSTTKKLAATVKIPILSLPNLD